MLRTRIVTALIAATVLLCVLFAAPESLARAVIVGVVLTGAWEWSGFIGAEQAGRLAFVVLVAALIEPAFLWLNGDVDRQTVLQIALVWWCLALIWTFFYPTPIAQPIAWLAGILVLVPAYVALDWLYQLGPWVLLFMLCIVFAADVGAYFSGKAFGRVKLAPKISPGKTWEGALGGLAAVSAVVAMVSTAAGWPIGALLPLGLAVAMISIIGDLTVSMFKRNAGLKDSGHVFPGHGGILDRADSVMAAAPMFALGILWLRPAALGVTQ